MFSEIRFVPIERWPGTPNNSRRRGPFRAAYNDRLGLLKTELRHLGATGVLIQAFLRPDQIRNDGWPRSGATPFAPGVIVTFQDRQGESLSFPCDTYERFEDNLYAIALSLESLRAVDRYGVTQRQEQYQGWKRLEAPTQERVRDRSWALSHLAALAQTTPGALSDPHMIDLAYRQAAKRTHPDSGGNVEAFQLLQDAMRLIRG